MAEDATRTLWNNFYKPDPGSANASESGQEGSESSDLLFQEMYNSTLGTDDDEDELSRYLKQDPVNPKLLLQNKVKGGLGWWKVRIGIYTMSKKIRIWSI